MNVRKNLLRLTTLGLLTIVALMAAGSTASQAPFTLADCYEIGFSTEEDFITRAGERRIMPDELTGATFTISNGGVFGSLLSTPIPSPPQTAVLGMHAIQKRSVVVNDEVVVRPMMYAALTYDHRMVDGREAVGFLGRIKGLVEDPTQLLLSL